MSSDVDLELSDADQLSIEASNPRKRGRKPDTRSFVERPPSAFVRGFTEWLALRTEYPADLKTVQAALAYHREYATSDEYSSLKRSIAEQKIKDNRSKIKELAEKRIRIAEAKREALRSAEERAQLAVARQEEADALFSSGPKARKKKK